MLIVVSFEKTSEFEVTLSSYPFLAKFGMHIMIRTTITETTPFTIRSIITSQFFTGLA
jgi:hypothetical protein